MRATGVVGAEAEPARPGRSARVVLRFCAAAAAATVRGGLASLLPPPLRALSATPQAAFGVAAAKALVSSAARLRGGRSAEILGLSSNFQSWQSPSSAHSVQTCAQLKAALQTVIRPHDK